MRHVGAGSDIDVQVETASLDLVLDEGGARWRCRPDEAEALPLANGTMRFTKSVA